MSIEKDAPKNKSKRQKNVGDKNLLQINEEDSSYESDSD